MKKDIKVKIAGNSYTIRSETDEDYTQHLARYVDNKMKEVTQGTDTQSSIKVAILAALNISNELFQLREKVSQQNEYIDRKATKLLSILESRLEESTTPEKIA